MEQVSKNNGMIRIPSIWEYVRLYVIMVANYCYLEKKMTKF